METGPRSVLIAWNSAAFDAKRRLLYFTGGGHRDYGGNEVYRFDLNKGSWQRLTEPSALTHLFIDGDYNERADKPWRRLCWMPDTRKVPASAHTYDGLQFSRRTDTLFYYAMRAANGTCFEDRDDRYRDSPLVLGKRTPASAGWYEFNPSTTETRNGLAPLAWRRVFDYEQLRAFGVETGFPVTAELDDGRIVFGSRHRTLIYDPADPSPRSPQAFSQQADWGVGSMRYDPVRDLVWSIHRHRLLAFDANNGRLTREVEADVDHGKSLAITDDGDLVCWNGVSKIYRLNPDEDKPRWRSIDWRGNGPMTGDHRVYGKWVFIKGLGVFAGLSSERTGAWIYKPPEPRR